MKLRKLLKREEGATAVVVALCMTVLLGFTAFAVDYGMMVMHRQSLQNAVDAAVLAGGQDLDKGAIAVRATVKEYCKLNGYDPDSDDTVQMEVKVTETQVTVSLYEDVRMGFSSVVTGKNVQTVGASAKAGVGSFFADYPYSMFAIDPKGQGLYGEGIDTTIDGNIRSNSDIKLRTAKLRSGTATAAGKISFQYYGDEHNGNAEQLEPPDLEKLEEFLQGKMFTYALQTEYKDAQGNKILNEWGQSMEYQFRLASMVKVARGSRSLSDLRENGLYIYIDGDLGLYGWSSFVADFPVILVANGNIQVDQFSTEATRNYPIILISIPKKNADGSVKTGTGNINIYGSSGDKGTYCGIMYAPGGTITCNGVNSTMGRLIGESIILRGCSGTIGYTEDYDNLFPSGKIVHLLE